MDNQLVSVRATALQFASGLFPSSVDELIEAANKIEKFIGSNAEEEEVTF